MARDQIRFFKLNIVIAAMLLAGCSTVQTTSGARWIGALPPVSQLDGGIEQRVREAADVEPILRLPARIGVAKIGLVQGRLTLARLSSEEAAAWVDLAEYLGPDYGELVPISPLVVAMVAPSQQVGFGSDSVRATIDLVRVAAARQHVDAVLIYEADATADSKNNPLAIADWTLIGAFMLPSQNVKARGVAQGTLIDVRNGYHYGTIQASADDKTIAARFANREAEHELSKQVETAAVKNLALEARGFMRQLRIKLAAVDRPMTR